MGAVYPYWHMMRETVKGEMKRGRHAMLIRRGQNSLLGDKEHDRCQS
jgi:hypothetical protein